MDEKVSAGDELSISARTGNEIVEAKKFVRRHKQFSRQAIAGTSGYTSCDFKKRLWEYADDQIV